MTEKTVTALVMDAMPLGCPVELDGLGWSLFVGEYDEEGGQIIITIEPFAKGADMVALGLALQKVGEELPDE